MNDMTVWNPDTDQLPAHLINDDEVASNVMERNTVPSLSYEGKVWAVHKDGNKTKLLKRNDDGDMEPISIMRVVILGLNNNRGRAFYPGTYDPTKASQPECWSADSEKPDPNAKSRQAETCASCPQSIKGSKVVDGKEMIACASHRNLAVVPSNDIGFDPLRLKIAQTSDYAKELVEHGWFAFRQYNDFLKSRGIDHTAKVVTKIKFDPTAAYPKLLFSLDRPVNAQEWEQVKAQLKNPAVETLLAEKWTPAGRNGVEADDTDPAGSVPASQQVIDGDAKPAAASTPATHDPHAAALADGWVQHPQSEPHGYKGQEVLAWADIHAKYPAPAAAAVPTPAPPPAPAPEPAPVTHDPHAAALADGWVQHPQSEPHGYKGQEVLVWADIHAKYPAPGNAVNAVTAAASVPASTPESGPPASSAGQTATSSASPSSETAIPADVQNLLDAWAGS